MNEDFLHHIWKQRLYNLNGLSTTEGLPIVVREPGIHNHSSGPDFSEGRISIDGVEWAGSVEIHIKSSDWMAHGHSSDSAYGNVILHVVFEHDQEIYDVFGQRLQTLELKGRIPAMLIQRFVELKSNKEKIACQSFINDVPSIAWQNWLSRMLVERLERKSIELELIHTQANDSWKQTFYMVIAGCIGQQYNKLPMIELARKLPYSMAVRMDDPHEREAALLGVSGFLDGLESGHALESSVRSYSFLNAKYGLGKVTQGWKTGKVRPGNAPSRRVAQFAAMIPFMDEAYDKVMRGEAYDWSAQALHVDPFWKQHFSIKSQSTGELSTNLSTQLADLVNINAHAPFVFYYGLKTGSQEHRARAVALLESTKSEQNAVLKMWGSLGKKASNAAESQAMLELFKHYCSHKKCVNCNVGKTVISSR